MRGTEHNPQIKKCEMPGVITKEYKNKIMRNYCDE